MKRNVLLTLIPAGVVVVCCLVILVFNWSFDLYEYVGASSKIAEFMAGCTSAAIVIAAAYLMIFNIFKDA